jgi:hypothetical protein
VQIASKHNILPQNLQNWKKTFLANAEIAMEPSKAVKEYKENLNCCLNLLGFYSFVRWILLGFWC